MDLFSSFRKPNINLARFRSKKQSRPLNKEKPPNSNSRRRKRRFLLRSQMDSTIDIQSILEHKYIYNPRLTFKNMIDVQEKKNKIISFLKVSGPSLPVRIAKVIEMDPVFASAISSELLNSKQ